MDIYGAAMLDMGYQIGPERPELVRRGAADEAAGLRGRVRRRTAASSPASGRAASASRASCPPSLGELKTIFEFELFGTGVDAGQTTFRLRHAYGELGQIGAGQTWSPFMDLDVFPNSIEYWGPNGMVFFRNVQLRWMPCQKGDSNFTIALERPGASADQGNYAGRIELEGVVGRFPLPDLSAQFRKAGGWGHVEVAGIAAPDQVGRPERRPVRPLRRAPPAGASTSART